MSKVDEILEFWFGKEGESGTGEFREEWFAADSAFDGKIRERFSDTHEEARQGRFDHWRESSESALALVIVLDQFSRNMFRNSPRMYEADDKALSVARGAVDRGFDRELPTGRKWFFYMPFMHSEDLEDQRRSVELFQGLPKNSESHLEYGGVGHKETIECFGRFPHRNGILGRESTSEEVEFLNERNQS